MMKSEITAADFSKHLFWDVDLRTFDLEKFKQFFVQRVIEYGLIEDWGLLQKLYGLEEIKILSLHFRTLDAVSLSFLSTIFNIDKTEFRCYRNSQLSPNVCNS